MEDKHSYFCIWIELVSDFNHETPWKTNTAIFASELNHWVILFDDLPATHSAEDKKAEKTF